MIFGKLGLKLVGKRIYHIHHGRHVHHVRHVNMSTMSTMFAMSTMFTMSTMSAISNMSIMYTMSTLYPSGSGSGWTDSDIGEKPILSFETRSGIVFFQSSASRRERDFVHRISSLETRSRILFTESRALRRDREFCSSNLEIRDEIEIFRSFYQNILLSQKKDVSHKRSNITVQLEEEGS